MKIVLDTNIWISYLISNDLKWIDHFFESEKIQLLFSEKLLSEFLTVASRPKLIEFFAQDKLRELLVQFEGYGQMVSTSSQIASCRDPNDNFLLNLAVDGKADYLVTGDKDLLSMKSIESYQIITLATLKTKVILP